MPEYPPLNAKIMQLERMAAVGQLTVGVSHELNTPVDVLRSTSDVGQKALDKLELLVRDMMNTQTSQSSDVARVLELLRDNYSTIRQSSDRIGNAVRTLQQFTRLDQASIQEYNVAEGIDCVLDLLKSHTAEPVLITREYNGRPTLSRRSAERMLGEAGFKLKSIERLSHDFQNCYFISTKM